MHWSKATKFMRLLALVFILFSPNFSLSDESPHEDDLSSSDLNKDEGTANQQNKMGLQNDIFDQDEIIVISRENITKILSTQTYREPFILLLALYAPWCHHCDPLLEQMQEALEVLSKWWKEAFSDSSSMATRPQLGKIDATIETNLAQFFKIKGYPTLKLVLSLPSGDKLDSVAKSKETTISQTNMKKNKEKGSQFFIFDYDDKSKSRDDLISFLLHYWFRYIYSPSPHRMKFSPVIWMKTAEQFKYVLNTHRALLLPAEHQLSATSLQSGSIFHQNYTKCPFHEEQQNHLEDNTVVFAMCQSDGEVDENYNTREKYHEQFNSEEDYSLEDPISYSEEDFQKDLLDAAIKEKGIDEEKSAHKSLQLEFEEAASYMFDRKNVAFFSLSSESCYQLGILDFTTIRAIYPPFDDKAIQSGPSYNTATNSEQSVMDFVKEQITPRLVWFDREKNAKDVFRGDFSIHTCLFVEIPNTTATPAEKWIDMSPETRKAIVSIKKSVKHFSEHKENVFLIISNKEQRIVNYFNIKSFPTVMITDMRNSNATFKYFLYEDDILKSEDSITSFFRDFYENKLSPTLKSQPISQNDMKKAVKVVKGNSFQSMVMEGSKHALVNFYAPWCGHSKHLTPKWNELAQVISRSKELMDKIDIMKMDATKNEVGHPAVDILVFPTIYFFPLGNKSQPIRYDGNGTDPDDFIDWISLHEMKLKNDIDMNGDEILMHSSHSMDATFDEL